VYIGSSDYTLNGNKFGPSTQIRHLQLLKASWSTINFVLFMHKSRIYDLRKGTLCDKIISLLDKYSREKQVSKVVTGHSASGISPLLSSWEVWRRSRHLFALLPCSTRKLPCLPVCEKAKPRYSIILGRESKFRSCRRGVLLLRESTTTKWSESAPFPNRSQLKENLDKVETTRAKWDGPFCTLAPYAVTTSSERG